MAKKAKIPRTNPAIKNISKDKPPSKKPKSIVPATFLVVFFALVGLFVSYVLINASEDNKPEEALEPIIIQEEPERVPINLEFSGQGQSSTEQFDLRGGNYLINYTFINNTDSYSSYGATYGTNFRSTIKCDDGFERGISNRVSLAGEGSEYIRPRSNFNKCVYEVSSAATSAQWRVEITEN